jgi:uncharacterized YccA/Bax inhibitor family protein
VALQTRNPAFQSKAAKGRLASAGMASMDAAAATRVGPIADPTTRPLTINGTVHITALLLGIVFVAAYIGWRFVTVDPFGGINVPVWLFPALIGALIVAFVTIFRPQSAHITAPIYAVLEGLVLGALSHIFELEYDGIVLQAIVATMGVAATMLVLYRSGRIRVTPRFMKGVVGATFGILIVYVFGWIASAFGADIRFWDEPSPLGIIVTLGIVVIAALNLVLDFHFIEQAAADGIPRQWEWYFAFGVVITLVWLYIELLRLLSLFAGRD